MEKLYLVDVSGLCYRAYYAISGLTTSYGQPTQAVFGFTNTLNKILKQKPDYIACCLDVSRDTLRRKEFSAYKMHRPKMPDDLASQLGMVNDVISAYRIEIFKEPGYEADDLIASLAKKAKAKGLEVIVVSSDKDLLQLVDDNVKQFDPRKDSEGALYDKKAVQEKYGLRPNQIISMLSLMGDQSDNIPGAKGIGQKTAVKLIQEFGDIFSLLENIEKVKSDSLKKILKENKEDILLSYRLVELRDDLEVEFSMDKLRLKDPDYDSLYSIFRKLEFGSLIKSLSNKVLKPQVESKTEIIKGPLPGELKDLILDKKELFLMLEDGASENIYFSCGDLINRIAPGAIKNILSDPSVRKIGHNLKGLKAGLFYKGLAFEGIYFDTMLAAYLLNSSIKDFNLKPLAFDYLGQGFSCDGSQEDALSCIIKLYRVMAQKLKENGLEKIFFDIEIPLIDVLAHMQANGVCIDKHALADLSLRLDKRLKELEKEIFSLNFDKEFNLNSPKQLADVLFNGLGLKSVKKTKTGHSTDEEVLRLLSKEHKLPLLVLEYRQLSKLKSTYADSLPELIDSKTNRIHAVFDQVGTETGRFSSSGPNLQNIPLKGEFAGIIRKAFICQKGWEMISADYSQIELRILAHFSRDKALEDAFNRGLDIHKYTASLIFGVKDSEVSEEMRQTAKRINFGIIYGMSGFGLSKDLAISKAEAENFIDAYFLRYSGVKSFIDTQIHQAKSLGYVTTLFGRRRYLEGINSNNKAIASFAQRQAVNSPIQGSAADLIKLAMVNIHKAIREKNLRTMMIMQIHDELVFESPGVEVDEAVGLIKDKMEDVFKLRVSLEVNIKKGRNWFQMEPV